VVRTKTKYKLKANCRLQLRFYLQSYMDYWTHEKCLETNSLTPLATMTSKKDLECRIMLKDLMLNQKLLLDVSNRHRLNAINLSDEKRLVFEEDDATETSVVAVVGEEEEKKDEETKSVNNINDVSMNE